MKTLVLGAGLNGLIAGFIKSCPIIGLSKAQDNNSFPLGPRFLHYSDDLKKLLMRLGLSLATGYIKVGYFYNNEVHDTIPAKLQQSYNLKTRGNLNFNKTALSAGQNRIKVFDVSMTELYNALLIRLKPWQIITEEITKIDTFKKIVHTKEEDSSYDYDNLISTLPAPVFFKLTGAFNFSASFKSKSKHFYLMKDFTNNLKNYEYIYYPEAGNVSRVSKRENLQVVETVYPDILLSQNALDYIILPHAQITNKVKLPKYKDIKFIGRFACWQHNKKVNEVITDVKALRN